MTVAESRAHTQIATLAEWAEDYATRAERRAVNARKHASEARPQAEQYAVDGDRYVESVHRREAELHEGAAARQLESATTQRARLRLSIRRELSQACEEARDDP